MEKEDKNDLVGLLLYVLICFSASSAIGLIVSLSGGLRASVTVPLLVLLMFVPLIAGVVANRLTTNESLSAFGLTIGELRYYLLAVLYPFGVTAIGLPIVALLGTASINFGNLVPFLGNILILLIAPFINFIPAFGEEFGWRGFLLSKLTKRLGVIGGVAFTGLIWGLWHAPIILNGYNYPNHPDILGVTLFCAWCVLVGFFLSWLRLKSGSVFSAAFCHGAINAYIGFGFILAPNPDEVMTIPLGIPGLLALLVLAVPFVLDLSRARGSHRHAVSGHLT